MVLDAAAVVTLIEIRSKLRDSPTMIGTNTIALALGANPSAQVPEKRHPGTQYLPDNPMIGALTPARFRNEDAVTTCVTASPDEWPAARATHVHVVPDTLVTVTISVPMMALNCVGGDAELLADGKPDEDVTVNDVAPDDGDDVRVVAALSANSSFAIYAAVIEQIPLAFHTIENVPAVDDTSAPKSTYAINGRVASVPGVES
jgi:hypothetical protein